MRTISDEVKLFARMAIFGLVVGAVYGLLTGERAGTVLLIAFGIAAGVAALALFAGSRRGRSRPVAAGGEDRATAQVAADAGAAGHPNEPIPEPGWAPLGVAVGIGGLALGAAYGPWLAIGGLLIAIVGGWNWLSAAMREADTVAGGRTPRT